MLCISAQDPQLSCLVEAIAQRVGQQRFQVWFNNSTRLELKNDCLEIAVPNDFISEWIAKNYSRAIQESAQEVLGGPLVVRFSVTPRLFEIDADAPAQEPGEVFSRAGSLTAGVHERSNSSCSHGTGDFEAELSKPRSAGSTRNSRNRVLSLVAGTSKLVEASPVGAVTERAVGNMKLIPPALPHGLTGTVSSVRAPVMRSVPSGQNPRLSTDSTPRLRHDLESFVVGQGNQMAFNAAVYVAEFPGIQYNPLFIHGNCGLGKTHLLQGLCKRFIEHHPTKRWVYLTGEEFTNDFLSALRTNKIDSFRRRMRDLDLLVIDDVHFLGGKKATQEEFLHTFNAIEAMGRQMVMVSDDHPKMIEEFGESLINRFVSGMVVRIDPPNFATRCEILRSLSHRGHLQLSEEVIAWIARRVTQNVRELEGAMTRIAAHMKLTGRPADAALAQESLGDLDRQMVAPVKLENILQAVCNYFALEHKDLMSGRRQRTISLARSIAMFLIRKTAKLSFPEIGSRMGKRNHSTVISACRRIERAAAENQTLLWTSGVGDRQEEATELLQRLEEHSRTIS